MLTHSQELVFSLGKIFNYFSLSNQEVVNFLHIYSIEGDDWFLFTFEITNNIHFRRTRPRLSDNWIYDNENAWIDNFRNWKQLKLNLMCLV